MKWFALFLASTLTAACGMPPKQPVEIGSVKWGRDLDQALATSKTSNKPVFLLFQEVPGCAGCKQFGQEVLSDPLIVEAIENEFTPLMIPNNQTGQDAAVLKRFKEPAWNYQVVRFLDSEARDLIPRKDKVWSKGPLAQRMVGALEKAQRPVPAYLSLVAAEASPNLRTAAFSMFCFWTGESKLGAIDGVVTTEAGWIGGKEVTLVKYDPASITIQSLIKQAQQLDCAHGIYLPAAERGRVDAGRLKMQPLDGYRVAKAGDQKKQIQGTPAASLKLNGAQATKVNAWIRRNPEKAKSFLSPAQLKRL